MGTISLITDEWNVGQSQLNCSGFEPSMFGFRIFTQGQYVIVQTVQSKTTKRCSCIQVSLSKVMKDASFWDVLDPLSGFIHFKLSDGQLCTILENVYINNLIFQAICLKISK